MTDDEIRKEIEAAAERAGFEIVPPDEMQQIMEQMQRNKEEHDAEAKREGKRFLDEAQDKELIETWWREAKQCRSIEAATEFATRLANDYQHDYGTICHAVAASGVAMANAVGLPAGVTGFQAGFIGWMLHANWMQWGSEPRRIVDYSDLLYPQKDYTWGTISKDVHEWIISEANRLLKENELKEVHPNVRARWALIASGHLPGMVLIEDENDR